MKKQQRIGLLASAAVVAMVLPANVALADESSTAGNQTLQSDAVVSSCPVSDSAAETFHDDFSGSGVNTNNWTSVGSLGGKYYISEEYASYLSPDDVEVKDGNLKLWLRQDGNKNFTWVGKDSPKNSNGWGWKAPYTGKMPAWNAQTTRGMTRFRTRPVR